MTGRVANVQSDEFGVDETPGADPHSGYRRGYRRITVDTHTIFQEGSGKDLRVGAIVDIIGLKLNATMLRATRISIRPEAPK